MAKKKARKPPRIIFEIVPHRRGWEARARGGKGQAFERKVHAVWHAADCCNVIEAMGGRAQLVIHKANGQFQEERTYPDETPRSKG